MPTRFIAREAPAAIAQTGNHAGIGVDSDDNRLYFNPRGTRFAVGAQNLVTITAARTALSSESGTTFVINDTTSRVLTLPLAASVPGAVYTYLLLGLTSTAGHAVSPNAADKIVGNAFTPLADKDAICTAATDEVGDFITLQSDGGTSWYITGIKGIWARET
jgi:hypothetical protein